MVPLIHLWFSYNCGYFHIKKQVTKDIIHDDFSHLLSNKLLLKILQVLYTLLKQIISNPLYTNKDILFFYLSALEATSIKRCSTLTYLPFFFYMFIKFYKFINMTSYTESRKFPLNNFCKIYDCAHIIKF